MEYITNAKDAPGPGFYSQAVIAHLGSYKLTFLAGQTGNDPNLPGEPVVEGGVGPQTTQALKNILAVIEAAGGQIWHIAEINVFLKDYEPKIFMPYEPYTRRRTIFREMARQAFAKAYEEFFRTRGRSSEAGNLPARTLVWVSEIPLESENMVVELTARAVIPG